MVKILDIDNDGLVTKSDLELVVKQCITMDGKVSTVGLTNTVIKILSNEFEAIGKKKEFISLFNTAKPYLKNVDFSKFDTEFFCIPDVNNDGLHNADDILAIIEVLVTDDGKVSFIEFASSIMNKSVKLNAPKVQMSNVMDVADIVTNITKGNYLGAGLEGVKLFGKIFG
jgi:hypothetical protein